MSKKNKYINEKIVNLKTLKKKKQSKIYNEKGALNIGHLWCLIDIYDYKIFYCITDNCNNIFIS